MTSIQTEHAGPSRTARVASSETEHSTDSINLARPENPFTSPYASANASSIWQHHEGLNRRYFHSRRIKKGEIEKPWLNQTDPREKWVWIIPLIGALVGIGIAGFIIWRGLQTVQKHNYCPVLVMDDFSGGLDEKIWTKEVELGGFGNGEFEQTTTSQSNIFIDASAFTLNIKPTLQDAGLILTDNKTIDLRPSCTSSVFTSCVATTNLTNGTIIPPVLSGRINTKKGASIRFGRVEVVAQLPRGDWLWPAIWLLPVNYTYGPWPASGEIDISESRGNNHTYPLGGNNVISSSLHWGPAPDADAWYKTNRKQKALHTTYASRFHTFGLEWSEKYIFTWVNTRLLQVLYTDFKTPFWQRGKFPASDANGTRFVDPWSQTGKASTPFDQNFYLILNVAVGGTNGWWMDGEAGKPWVDASSTARRDFWQARNQWLPTWGVNGDGAKMVIKSVKIWQQEGYNGC